MLHADQDVADGQGPVGPERGRQGPCLTSSSRATTVRPRPAMKKYIDALHAPVRADAELPPGHRREPGLTAPGAGRDGRGSCGIVRGTAIFQKAFEKAKAESDTAASALLPLSRECTPRVHGPPYTFSTFCQARPQDSRRGKRQRLRTAPVGFARTSQPDLLSIAEDTKVNSVAEGQPAKPWLDWLKDYAALVAEKGVPVPDELKGADPNTYRLIQACMMDSTSTGWRKAEGATDGWARAVGVQRVAGPALFQPVGRLHAGQDLPVVHPREGRARSRRKARRSTAASTPGPPGWR